MKIIFICAFLTQEGGFENEVEATAELARSAGHSVSIFTPHKVQDDATIRRNLPKTIPLKSAQEMWRCTLYGGGAALGSKLKHYALNRRKPTAYEEIQLARSRIPSSFYREFWSGRGARMLKDFDVVHLFGKPKSFLVEAARCAKSIGIKTAYEEVAQVNEEYANQHDHRSFIGSSNLCDLVIARCEQHAQDIRNWFKYEGKTEIIEQWAYDNEERLLQIQQTKDSQSQPGDVVFGSLSRLGPEKGLDTMLRGFSEALKRVPNIRLKIGGQGAVEGELRQQAKKLGVDRFVEFTGYVSKTEKVKFYSSVDAFLIASRIEGGPVIGVEAMAAGLPIVTTPVGAMPERLQNETEAIFFDIDSVSGLCSAMVRLATDASLRKALGAAARSRYRVRNHSSVCTLKKTEIWNTLSRV